MVLTLTLSGCPGDRHLPAAAQAGCPEAKAVAQRTILPGAGGWVFGEGPVYVSFLDTPFYRGKGTGTSVLIYRGGKRYGGYAVKMMTILHPRFAGTMRQEISAVTPGGRTGFGLGRGSSVRIERLLSELELKVNRSQDLIPGSVVFSGPGCYRLALEAEGRRYEFSFPVRFGRDE